MRRERRRKHAHKGSSSSVKCPSPLSSSVLSLFDQRPWTLSTATQTLLGARWRKNGPLKFASRVAFQTNEASSLNFGPLHWGPANAILYVRTDSSEAFRGATCRSFAKSAICARYSFPGALICVGKLSDGITPEDAAFSGSAEYGSSPCAQVAVGINRIYCRGEQSRATEAAVVRAVDLYVLAVCLYARPQFLCIRP